MKIKFIKENDLFEWSVGDIATVTKYPTTFAHRGRNFTDYKYTFTNGCYFYSGCLGCLTPTNLIEEGYAEEIKEVNWKEWVEKKKREYWAHFFPEGDGIVHNPTMGGAWYYDVDSLQVEIQDWQLRHMYLWILQEYAKEINEGWKPDWKDGGENKYYIYIDEDDKEFKVHWITVMHRTQVHFRTEELAEQCIKNIRFVLDKVFGVA